MIPASVSLSDLNGQNGYYFTVDQSINAPFPRLDKLVAGGCDLNNDGYPDFVIGVPNLQASGSSAYHGKAFVTYGRNETISNLASTSLNGNQGFTIAKSTSMRIESVACLKDINGDGINDLALGTPSYNCPSSGFGQVFILYGRNSNFPATVDPSSLSSSEGFIIQRNACTATSDLLGTSIADAGDVNNDGVNDLILGAPRSLTSDGDGYIVYGKNSNFGSTLDLSLLGADGVVIKRPDPYNSGTAENFGGRVSSAGDFNNDGFDDFIVGYPQENMAYLLYGSNSLPTVFNTSSPELDGSNGFVISRSNWPGAFRASNEQSFGFSLSPLGDVNGDGIDDIVIGDHRMDTLDQTSTGRATVIFGQANYTHAQLNVTYESTFDKGFNILGAPVSGTTNPQVGISVSGAGDVNADGINDILVGSGGNVNSKGFVVYGKNSSSIPPLNVTDIDGTNGFTLEPTGLELGVARYVTAVGDINGDRGQDIALGSYTVPFPNNLRNFIVFGTPRNETHDVGTSTTTLSVASPASRLESLIGKVASLLNFFE